MHAWLQIVLAHAGPVLLASALVLSLPGVARRPWRWLAPLVCAAGLSVRWGDFSPVEWFRGVAGDLSIVTILLLSCRVWRRLSGRDLLPAKEQGEVVRFAALAGAVLYPSALGLGTWDAYRLGYAPLVTLLPALLALAVWARLAGRRSAIVVPVVILAWCSSLLESTNLWDYLVDPFVAVYGLGWSVAAVFRGRGSRVRPSGPAAS